MNLVDTHCHIQSINARSTENDTRDLWSNFTRSVNQVIEDAKDASVNKLICVGNDLEDSQLAVSFVQKHANCYASIGIHPHEASTFVHSLSALKELAMLTNHKKVVAIGECGLDYHYNHSKPEDQKAVLRAQLDLALKQNLPAIFHVREAYDDFWPIFDAYKEKLRGVLHSFSGSMSALEEAMRRNLYIGVNGIATFTKDKAQLDVFKAIPDHLLLLETDAPYLTPPPYRGNINEPKYLLATAEFLAELRGVEVMELAKLTTDNAHSLFKI